jgi:uncharacterized protein (DUF885 family)
VSVTETFAALAGDYLDDLTSRHPDAATSLGDHRYDDRLPDVAPAALAEERRALDGFAGRLAAIDTTALTAELRVDAAMLSDSVARRIFELDELHEHTWNPLLANPGSAIYDLLARDFAPLPDRLASVAGRLAQIPAALEDARGSLGAMRKRAAPSRSTRPGRPRSPRSARTSNGCPTSSPTRRTATSPIRGSARSASRASCR